MTMLPPPIAPFSSDALPQPGHSPAARLPPGELACLPDVLGSLRTPVEKVACKALDAIHRLACGFALRERGDSPSDAKTPTDKAPQLAQRATTPPPADSFSTLDSDQLLARINLDDKSNVVSLTEVRDTLNDPSLPAPERYILGSVLAQAMLSTGQTSRGTQEFKDNANLLARTPW